MTRVRITLGDGEQEEGLFWVLVSVEGGGMEDELKKSMISLGEPERMVLIRARKIERPKGSLEGTRGARTAPREAAARAKALSCHRKRSSRASGQERQKTISLSSKVGWMERDSTRNLESRRGAMKDRMRAGREDMKERGDVC